MTLEDTMFLGFRFYRTCAFPIDISLEQRIYVHDAQ